MLTKSARVLALIVAVFVIILSLASICGAWWANTTLSNITVQTFTIVNTGVNVVDTGVGRVERLVQTGRTEVQQTADTIVSVADDLRANRPILTALSERVETRLGPTVDQINQALAPVHEALTKISSVVSLLNSIPFINERAPRLDALDQALDRLSALAADIRQLRTTLREAALSEADRMTQAAVDVLTGVTTRIDDRLAETQANVQQVQADIQALRDELAARQARLLLIYNLSAIALTLILLWVIYSQVVVMRHHWRLLRRPAAAQISGSPATVVAASPASPVANTSPLTEPVAATPLEADPELRPADMSEALPVVPASGGVTGPADARTGDESSTPVAAE